MKKLQVPLSMKLAGNAAARSASRSGAQGSFMGPSLPEGVADRRNRGSKVRWVLVKLQTPSVT